MVTKKSEGFGRIMESKKQIIFGGGMLIGLFFFLTLYGVNVLDVTNDGWLLQGSDISQHYLGWVFYRRSPWYFPPGMMDNLFYPYLCSVIYTDSIPLFAFIFKVLSPVLPETFQYFGLFGLFCFTMQGGFGALLVGKLTEGIGNRCSLYCRSFLGAFFFLMATPLLQRMYGDSYYTRHTATAGQFVILAAFALWAMKDTFISLKKGCISWGMLAMVTALIHLNLVPMVFGIFLGYLFNRVLDEKKVIPSAYLLLSYVIMTIVPLFLMGAFYYPFHPEAGGLGFFTANLNALWNPMGYSSVFQDLPVSSGQYEGMSYGGFGVLLLAAISFLLFGIHVGKRIKEKKGLKEFLVSIPAEKKRTGLSLLIVAISFCLLAVSTSIEFNEHVLLKITLPDKLYQIFSMFRASGRFMWVDLYLLITAAIVLGAKYIESNGYIIFLYLCVAAQFFDLKYKLRDIQDNHKDKKEYVSEILYSPIWEQIGEYYDYIMFMDSDTFVEVKGYWPGYDFQYAFAKLAADYGMVLNGFHVSRVYKFKEESDAEQWEKLERGEVMDNAVYIFEQSHLPKEKHLNFYIIDHIIIGTVQRLEGVPIYEF